MKKKRALTPTSFAILGQLAHRPWAAYELSQHMSRNFRFFWPRADSLVYAEMKALASADLASATRARTGGRTTTTYRITAAGRRELSRWLASAPAQPVLEFETLLRVFMSPFGRVGDIRTALAGLDEFIEQAYETARTVGTEYVRGTAAFQRQVHVRALVFDFLTSFFMLFDDWRGRVEREVARWPDMTGGAAAQERAIERIAAILETELMPRLQTRARPQKSTRKKQG